VEWLCSSGGARAWLAGARFSIPEAPGNSIGFLDTSLTPRQGYDPREASIRFIQPVLDATKSILDDSVGNT
jgi:hypothetical protein